MSETYEVEVGDVKLKRGGTVLNVIECTAVSEVAELDPNGGTKVIRIPTWKKVGYIEFDPI